MNQAFRLDLGRLISGRAVDLDLQPGAVDLIRALAESPQAWTTIGGLNGYAGAVEGLVERGILVRWQECPDGPAVTLTPFGAAALGLAVVERWEKAVGADPETGKPYSGVIETPEWDDAGRAAYQTPLSAPRYAREVSLVLPDTVPDACSPSGPEYLTEIVYDPATGGEVEKNVELFAGGEWPGVPIRVDRRLGRKER